MTNLERLSVSMQKSGPDNWVRHSTAEEIKALELDVLTIPDREITAILDDWSFITVSDLGTCAVHVIGNLVGTTKTRVTSPVIVADWDAWKVMTASGSIYDLGIAHIGELDMQQVLALAKSISNWRARSGKGNPVLVH